MSGTSGHAVTIPAWTNSFEEDSLREMEYDFLVSKSQKTTAGGLTRMAAVELACMAKSDQQTWWDVNSKVRCERLRLLSQAISLALGEAGSHAEEPMET